MNKALLALLFMLCGTVSVACKQDDAKGGSPFRRSLAQRESSLSENAPAPDFELPDISGKKLSLKDLRGKVVLLNFWATWCAPCVMEMPALERLHQLLQDSGFVVVAVSADAAEKSKDVEEFVRKNGISFPVLRDPDFKVVESYGLSGFPESFFIGPAGELLAIDEPGKARAVRLVSDRAWDSPAFVGLIKTLVESRVHDPSNR